MHDAGLRVAGQAIIRRHETAPPGDTGTGSDRVNPEIGAQCDRNLRELVAGVLVDTLRVGIARLRSVRNQWRQACDLGARPHAFAIHLRAQVQVAGQFQVVIHDGVQRAFRQPAIAHFEYTFRPRTAIQ